MLVGWMIAYQHVDAFDNIQENLVLAISDTLRPPGYRVSDSHGWSDLDLEFVGLLSDIFLEDLALGGLGVSKVHHLIHKLVDDNKVVPDTFFFELLEVFNQDLNEAMKEDDDLCGIAIAFGEGQDYEGGELGAEWWIFGDTNDIDWSGGYAYS